MNTCNDVEATGFIKIKTADETPWSLMGQRLPSHPDACSGKVYRELMELKEKIDKSWRHVLKQKLNKFCRRFHIKFYIKQNELETKYYRKLEECLRLYSTFGCFTSKNFTDELDVEIKEYSSKKPKSKSQNKNDCKKVKRIE